MPRICIELDGDGTSPTLTTYSTVVGDGAQLDFPINHNLGVRDAWVQAVEIGTGRLLTDNDVTFNSVNQATLRFDTPPAADGVRVNVVGIRSAA